MIARVNPSPRVPLARAGAFRPLRAGDRVAVLAPASPVKAEMLAEGLAELRRLGFEPVMRDDIGARWRYAAGHDARRGSELADALADPGIRAAWLARGGYGVTPLLAGLDPQVLARDPKPIIGESDATALGCWALAAGVAWIHGPMVATSLRQGAAGHDEHSLRSALAGESFTLEPPAARCLVPGRATGILWGGCLSLLAALAGTPWLAAPERSVLVVEDVGVKPYQVHRMLVQLRDAGALRGLSGLVLGDFSDCIQHADQGYDVTEIIADLVRDVAGAVPISHGWPIGHAAAPHLSLPMGWDATLEVDAGGTRLSLRPPT
jgi:muramoyltetrapeptide carboxypeptidase